MERILEKDLYEPVKEFFIEKGYDIKGEILGCDLLGYKNGEFICTELKRNFTIELLYQAVERQRFCKEVYVAIIYPKGGIFRKDFKKKIMLCRCLKIGLITVRFNKNGYIVNEHLKPSKHDRYKNYKKLEKIKKEFKNRTDDFNQGGSVRKQIVTVYRENSLRIARFLEKEEICTPKDIKNKLEIENASTILYKNYYGWFIRVSRGLYKLSKDGKEALIKYGYVLKSIGEESEVENVL